MTACSFSKPCAIGNGIKPADAGDRLIRVIELVIEKCRRGFSTAILDKDLIKAISDSGASHSEAINPDAMGRLFVAGPLVASHQEVSFRDGNPFRFKLA